MGGSKRRRGTRRTSGVVTDRPKQRAVNQRLIISTLPPALVAPGDPFPYGSSCPVCGADVVEEGGLGCCGAITATCTGAIDGAPVDWDALYADPAFDEESVE